LRERIISDQVRFKMEQVEKSSPFMTQLVTYYSQWKENSSSGVSKVITARTD
jgi:hypothetical protein